MASAVEISNMALQRLGQESIESLTDTTTLAEQCNLIYQQTVNELLMSYEWPFAIARGQAGWVETPASNYTPYSYVYNVPADSLVFLSILDANYEDSPSDWLIEGNLLYTDEINPLYVKYIDGTTDETRFPPLFITVLYLRMAMEMCIKITQDSNLLRIITQEYASAYLKATSSLGTNDKQADQPDDWWSE